MNFWKKKVDQSKFLRFFVVALSFYTKVCIYIYIYIYIYWIRYKYFNQFFAHNRLKEKNIQVQEGTELISNFNFLKDSP